MSGLATLVTSSIRPGSQIRLRMEELLEVIHESWAFLFCLVFPFLVMTALPETFLCLMSMLRFYFREQT